MFTIPTIPGVQTWRERARYSDLSVRLDEVIDDLYVLDDHDERAATLDLAADITAELAELHVGERAAVILTVLADIDERRAVGGHAYPADPAPPRWYRRGSRALIAAVFALAGAVMVAPGLDAATRLAVLLGVPAGVYAALFVFFRVRDRRAAGREAGA